MSTKQCNYFEQLEQERVTTLSILNRDGHGNDDPFQLQHRNRMQAKLRRIECALARLREGGFGLCQACGFPINPERLAAMPYAETCISCQRQLEKQTGPFHKFDFDERRSTHEGGNHELPFARRSG